MDWEHHYFQHLSLSINFFCGDITADAPGKGKILTLTTHTGHTLTLYNGET